MYFDIEVGEEEKGRVVFELFKQKVPKTAENFRCLSTGEKGQKLHYQGNNFHRIIPNFMMQGGDITMQNGMGGESIYGVKFADEKLWLPHTHPGLLSMANSGPDTNSSQFFITFNRCEWLNQKHTVFGRVIQGFEICQKAKAVKTGAQDKPLVPIRIASCGELRGDEKLSEEQGDFLATYKEPWQNVM